MSPAAPGSAEMARHGVRRSFLRQFRSATNEYTRVTANTGLFKNYDPNNHEFLRMYNCWANQWQPRHTGKVSITKVMWSSEELAVLFCEINKLLKKKGILKYKEIHKAEFNNTVTDKINDMTNGSRKGESVASMLRRTKGPVFELVKRAEDIKKRVNDGERLLKKELFPKEAIAMDQAAVEKDTHKRWQRLFIKLCLTRVMAMVVSKQVLTCERACR
jgi:hypothetical protein